MQVYTQATDLSQIAGYLKQHLNDPAIIHKLGLGRGAVDTSRGIKHCCGFHPNTDEASQAAHAYVEGGHLVDYCHGECKRGRDVLELIAHAEKISTKGRDFPLVLDAGARLAGFLGLADLQRHLAENPDAAPPLNRTAYASKTAAGADDPILIHNRGVALGERRALMTHLVPPRPWTADEAALFGGSTSRWPSEVARRQGLVYRWLAETRGFGVLTDDLIQRRRIWALPNVKSESLGSLQDTHWAIFPMRSFVSGEIDDLRARSIDPHCEVGKKSVSPWLGSAKHHLGCMDPITDALALCTPDQWDGCPPRIVLAEGEVKGAAARVLLPDDIGVAWYCSGAWSSEIAAKIPDGSEIHILNDSDAAGVKYGLEIAEAIAGRCSVWLDHAEPAYQRSPDGTELLDYKGKPIKLHDLDERLKLEGSACAQGLLERGRKIAGPVVVAVPAVVPPAEQLGQPEQLVGPEVLDALPAVPEAPVPSAMPCPPPAAEASKAGDVEGEGKEEKRRAAALPDLLVSLAAKKILESFADLEGRAYATLVSCGRRCTMQIDGAEFADELVHLCDQVYGTCPSGQSVSQAQAVLASRARRSGPRRKVWTRIARHGSAIYLDLCDDGGRVVRVDAIGWQVTTECPLAFIRMPGMLPLPVPLRNSGSLQEIFGFVNVSPESRPLVLGWLISLLHPEGPYPILCVGGEQGSGKSTLIKILRRLVDPHVAELRLSPPDDKTVAIAARAGWLLGYDNLSSIAAWLSDLLCVLSTGGAYTTKTLYTTVGETILALRRPVAICGIPDLATRGDLLDRAVVVTLDALDEGRHKTEDELFAAYEEARPGILGALMDAVSGAMRRLPKTCLEKTPRMADFAKWATAAEEDLGLEAGAFMEAYSEAADASNEVTLANSPLADPIRKLLRVPDTLTASDVDTVMDGHPLPPPAPAAWSGTAKELLADLRKQAGLATADKSPPGWPGNERALSSSLRRLAPLLRRAGIEFSQKRRVLALRTK